MSIETRFILYYLKIYKNLSQTTIVENAICYAFMQVIDVVDDHTSQCLFYQKCF